MFKEYKAAYFDVLQQTRQKKDISIFETFMYAEYTKFLQQEIDKFEQVQSKDAKESGYSFVF